MNDTTHRTQPQRGFHCNTKPPSSRNQSRRLFNFSMCPSETNTKTACTVDEAVASLPCATMDDFMHLLKDEDEFREDFTPFGLPDVAPCSNMEWSNEVRSHGIDESTSAGTAEGYTSTDLSRTSSVDTNYSGSSPTPKRGSSPSTGGRRAVPWTKEEHATFLHCLTSYCPEGTQLMGRNGSLSVGLGCGVAQIIADVIGTRNAGQVRSHAQKHFQRIRRRIQADA